uniref:Protein kinase domain-containing protein n=1 Tax=Phytophthora ramorum TaxID=164328 RepID=H3HEG0_PHYRM
MKDALAMASNCNRSGLALDFPQDEYSLMFPPSPEHSPSGSSSCNSWVSGAASPAPSAKSSSSSSAHSPETKTKKWVRKEKIGQGAQGSIYRCEETKTGRDVAVKVIWTRELSPAAVEAVKREVKTMKRVRHRHLVRYLQATEKKQSELRIYMEFAPGVVGCVSLVGGLKGTPHWMAPEVIRQQNMEDGGNHERWFRADVWSLGCAVLEMITGHSPWQQYSNPLTAMYQIVSSDHTPTIPADVPEETASFLKLCLQRNPEHRATIKQLLAHPTSARPRERVGVPSNKISSETSAASNSQIEAAWGDEETNRFDDHQPGHKRQTSVHELGSRKHHGAENACNPFTRNVCQIETTTEAA